MRTQVRGPVIPEIFARLMVAPISATRKFRVFFAELRSRKHIISARSFLSGVTEEALRKRRESTAVRRPRRFFWEKLTLLSSQLWSPFFSHGHPPLVSIRTRPLRLGAPQLSHQTRRELS